MTAEELQAQGISWDAVEAKLASGEMVLRIVNWSQRFETAESRKMAKLHEFYKAPPGTESNGYKELCLAGTEGILAIGVFTGLCQAFTQQPLQVRRTNRWWKKSGTPMDLRRIAAEVRMPGFTVREALAFLCQEDVRWCEIDFCNGLELSDMPFHDGESPKSIPFQSQSDPDSFLSDSHSIPESLPSDSQTSLIESKSKRKSKKVPKKERENAGEPAEDFLEEEEEENSDSSSSATTSKSRSPSQPTPDPGLADALARKDSLVAAATGLNGHAEELNDALERWLTARYAANAPPDAARWRQLEKLVALAALSERHAEAVLERIGVAIDKDWAEIKPPKVPKNPNPNPDETLTRSATKSGTLTSSATPQDHAKSSTRPNKYAAEKLRVAKENAARERR